MNIVIIKRRRRKDIIINKLRNIIIEIDLVVVKKIFLDFLKLNLFQTIV